MAYISWQDYARGVPVFAASANMTAYTSTQLVAMFETADGCVRFQEVERADPEIVVAVSGRISPLERTKDAAAISATVHHRRYELVGRRDNMLHYKERVA